MEVLVFVIAPVDAGDGVRRPTSGGPPPCTGGVDGMGMAGPGRWMGVALLSEAHMRGSVIHSSMHGCGRRNPSCPQVFPILGTP